MSVSPLYHHHHHTSREERMSCSHDHHEHGGDGNGHGHGHGHDHSHDVPLEAGPQDSLYPQIDLEHVVALNAAGGGESGKNVIKPWTDREDEQRFCESDADDTMIIKIPFTSSVSIRSITIKAGPSGQTPSSVRIFRDRPEMDFSDCEAAEPTQAIDMIEQPQGVEYPVKAAKFAGVTSLTLFFPGNTSDGEEDTTRVFYIALRGTHQALPGRPGIILYEAAARPQDHATETISDAQGFRQGF